MQNTADLAVREGRLYCEIQVNFGLPTGIVQAVYGVNKP